ncbi:MAG: cysteine synthase A [Haliea sp.]|jgi:cysteine synthase A|uniref:cysteine synthase A n=1 Tax=Haliea sp. TaxID=1932666 RepID=UPI000C4758F1|nr:cysteine synthase A [Haliea sp.]MBM69273.1 cysteine synthase A [Haliea sp.]|tara:strand:+ start:61351 stop:62319 length:969 start_codon:yes stop_codon:yes gene_type:complete
MGRIFNDNSETIGGTPLVRINHISTGNVYAKLENRNPAMSVKCRIGTSMVLAAERDGSLKPGMTIVEPTSGNTGIALAFVAAARGYGCTLTMPNTMSLERRKLMKALGAEIILTDGSKGMPAAIARAEEIIASDPGRYWGARQFENPANPAIHERTTGPEIWQDTDGGIDILVAGVGTGGTLTGTSRYIKGTAGKAIQTIAVEPASTTIITAAKAGTEPTHAPHKIQGIGAGFLPVNLDLSMVDRVEQVSNEDAISWAHKLMQQEGILAGVSCGAAMAVADRVSREPENAGKMVVVILPDSGERYLSAALFEGRFSENEMVQ